MAKERKVSLQTYVSPTDRELFIKSCGNESPAEVLRAFVKSKVNKYKKECK